MTVSILVVDDESDVAELFRQGFRREVRQGTYEMHFANSEVEELEKLAGGIEPKLIVILSDINMPGMDGLTLLREIKKRWPDMTVMMVMAYSDHERRRMAEAYGAAEFIAKPVDFDPLKARLRELSNPASNTRHWDVMGENPHRDEFALANMGIAPYCRGSPYMEFLSNLRRNAEESDTQI